MATLLDHFGKTKAYVEALQSHTIYIINFLRLPIIFILKFERHSQLAVPEPRGISQGIGAYQVQVQSVQTDGKFQPCIFLGTPGHEAFGAMRSLEAEVTDIAIIVIVADDGIHPQSAEAEQIMNPLEVAADQGKIDYGDLIYNFGIAAARWEIDYNDLIYKFGCQWLGKSLIDRVQRLPSCSPHVFIHCAILFTPRNLNDILDAYERADKLYLYAGGPSSKALHLGHLIAFMFTNMQKQTFGNILSGGGSQGQLIRAT